MQRHARHAPATAIVLGLVFAALAPVWLPGTAHACTCEGDTTIGERFAAADAVFVGEAVEVRTARAGDPAEFERRYVFRVSDVFKGDVYELQSVVSPTEETACGLPWDQEGAIALVFGFVTGSATALPGELYASSCTTGPLGVLPDAPEFATAGTPIAGASPIRIAAQEASPGGSVHLTWTWVAVGVLLLAGVAVGAFPRRRSPSVGPLGDPFAHPPVDPPV